MKSTIKRGEINKINRGIRRLVAETLRGELKRKDMSLVKNVLVATVKEKLLEAKQEPEVFFRREAKTRKQVQKTIRKAA